MPNLGMIVEAHPDPPWTSRSRLVTQEVGTTWKRDINAGKASQYFRASARGSFASSPLWEPSLERQLTQADTGTLEVITSL